MRIYCTCITVASHVPQKVNSKLKLSIQKALGELLSKPTPMWDGKEAELG